MSQIHIEIASQIALILMFVLQSTLTMISDPSLGLCELTSPFVWSQIITNSD